MSATISSTEGLIRGTINASEPTIKGTVKIGALIQEGYSISVTFNDDGSQSIAITSPDASGATQ